METLIKKCELELQDEFSKVSEVESYYSNKVLNGFHKYNLSEADFIGTTGYGYNDIGRDKIEKIYADIFDSESALVRSQFISGTHALTTAFFALLRPNDNLLFISGKPYDTLDEVIGIKDNASSLKSYNINYDIVDLINDDFDYEKIKECLENKFYKVIEIQRSKGYSLRKSIDINKLSKVCSFIKKISPKTIIMVDNCYCEMVEMKSPISVGADIAVGSLIKNLGAGFCQNGGYIVGKTDLINLCAERLNVPGQGGEVGPSLGQNKNILQGLYMAPSVVASALKTAILTSKVMESLGYEVSPKSSENRCDIVQSIIFNDEDKLINFVQSIQKSSAVDAKATILPSDMPGYSNKIIMASGSFVQGSSIEISCDGPLKSPYVAYLQGSLTYEYGKIAILNAIKNLVK